MLATKMTKMHSVASNFAFEPARKQSSKTKNRSSLKKYLCSQETQQSQWRSHSRTTRCRAPAFRGATLLRNTLALWPWHLLKRLTSPTKNRSVVMLSCIETLTAKKPKLNAFFPGFCPFGPVIVSIEAAALPPTWRHGHNANQTNQIVQLTPNWHFIWKRLEIGHIFGQPPHHHIFTNPTKNLFYPIHEILFKPASVALPFELSQRVPFSWTLTWQQCWMFKLHNCTKSSDILESFGSWNVFGRNQIAKTKLGKEKRGTWTQKVWMQLNSWQQGQWKEIWSKHQTKMLPGHKNGALFGYVSVFWPSLSEKGLCGPYVLGAALVHLMNPALWTMIARLGEFVPTTA